MPTARGLPGVAWSRNRLYVIGGLVNSYGVDTVEAYDPTTHTWQTEAPIRTPRSHPAVGTLSDGRIIVAGGGPVPGTADVEIYTPSSNSWQQLTALPKASIPTGAVLNGKTFYVLGGWVGQLNASRSVYAAAIP